MHGCEIHCELLCACMSWILISNWLNFLALPDIRAFSRRFIQNAVSSWPRTILHPRCFCLAYHYCLSILFVNITEDSCTNIMLLVKFYKNHLLPYIVYMLLE